MLLQLFSGLKPHDRFKLKNFEKLKKSLDKKLIMPRAIKSCLSTVVATFEQKFQENKLVKALSGGKFVFIKYVFTLLGKFPSTTYGQNIPSTHVSSFTTQSCFRHYPCVCFHSIVCTACSYLKVTSSLYLHRHNKVCL